MTNIKVSRPEYVAPGTIDDLSCLAGALSDVVISICIEHMKILDVLHQILAHLFHVHVLQLIEFVDEPIILLPLLSSHVDLDEVSHLLPFFINFNIYLCFPKPFLAKVLFYHLLEIYDFLCCLNYFHFHLAFFISGSQEPKKLGLRVALVLAVLVEV